MTPTLPPRTRTIRRHHRNRVVFYLTDTEFRRLVWYADQNEKSMSEFIRIILAEKFRFFDGMQMEDRSLETLERRVREELPTAPSVPPTKSGDVFSDFLPKNAPARPVVVDDDDAAEFEDGVGE